MEGNWETGSRVPLLLFAVPDADSRQNRFEIGIPAMASVILKHDPDGVVPGLNDFVAADGTVMHPPVAPVFWSFRVMVGAGMAMLALSWVGVALMRKRGVDGLPRLYLGALAGASFIGWIATLAGWYTTEIGRQPWLVQGVLTTREAVAAVPSGMVLSTLIGYLAIYGALILAYMVTITTLAGKAAKGQPLPAHRPQLAPAE